MAWEPTPSYSIKIFEYNMIHDLRSQTIVRRRGDKIFEKDDVYDHEYKILEQSISRDHSEQMYTSTNYFLVVNSTAGSPHFHMEMIINADIKDLIIRTLQGSFGRGIGKKRGYGTGAPFKMSPIFLDH